MRKFFEGQTPVSLVLIFSTFAFACFLRLFDLDAQSPWTDEVASWFYLRHLDRVFLHESHTPFYYGLLRLILGDDASMHGIRFVSSFASVLHLVLAFVLGKKIFTRGQLLLFWVLICFNPIDIVYARMARHYSLLLESSLLFALLFRLRAPTWWLSLLACLMGFVHIFALIPVWIMMGIEYLADKNFKRLLLVLSSSSLVIFYYASRFFLFGGQKVVSNVSWNYASFLDFQKSLLLLYLGDSYPRDQFFPVSILLSGILVGGGLMLLAWKRPQSSKVFFWTLVFSCLAVEFTFLFGVNLRISRYLIYLVPLFIIAIVDSFKLQKEWPIYPVMVGSFLYLAWSNPLMTYPWDRESVQEWERFSSDFQHTPKLVCANPFQIEYYGFPDIHPCSSYLGQLDPSKPLLYFDLNGNDRMLSLYLSEKLNLADFKTHRQSLMIRFNPR